ncbi:hypothetical protein KY330_02400 [Candidatus Woesearchaeota archaeon]|nr:hypothetical protein [Candidatus Woesearchaeota archaeon]
MFQPKIRIIKGPMLDGKTEQMICFLSELERLLLEIHKEKNGEHELPEKTIMAFKQSFDMRYEGDKDNIVAASGIRFPCYFANSADEIYKQIENHTKVVGINEVQFLDSKVIKLCRHLKQEGKIIVTSLLDLDFRGEPFRFSDLKRDIRHLLPYGIITPGGRAFCDHVLPNGRTCNRRGRYSQRLICEDEHGEYLPAPYDDKLVRIGAKNPMQDPDDGLWCIYRVRCEEHFIVPKKPRIYYRLSK